MEPKLFPKPQPTGLPHQVYPIGLLQYIAFFVYTHLIGSASLENLTNISPNLYGTALKEKFCKWDLTGATVAPISTMLLSQPPFDSPRALLWCPPRLLCEPL